MTPIYLLNGKLLLRNGQLATSESCCCTPTRTVTPSITSTVTPTPTPTTVIIDPCSCMGTCSMVDPDSDNNVNIVDGDFNGCTKQTKTSRYGFLTAIFKEVGNPLIAVQPIQPLSAEQCNAQFFVEMSYGYISVSNNVPPKEQEAKTEYATFSWKISLFYLKCDLNNMQAPPSIEELDPAQYFNFISYDGGGVPDFILTLLPQGAPIPSLSLASDIIRTWSGSVSSGQKNIENTRPSDCANDIQEQPAPDLGLRPVLVC